LPIVIEQAHRKKSRMVRQRLPTQDGLILFMTITRDAAVQVESMPQAVLASVEMSPHRFRRGHTALGVSLMRRAGIVEG
jgi:hypothetical protein